jgi:hypothetical protein
VKDVGQQRVAVACVDDPLLVIWMRERLVRRDERGADHRALRAERHGGGHVGAVGDPARGQHRQARRAHHLWQQLDERPIAAHMPAGLVPLDDQRVRAGRVGRLRVVERADLMNHAHARIAQAPHDVRHHVPEQRDDRHPQFDACIELRVEQFARRRRRNQVHAERLRGGRANPLDLAPDQRDRLTHHPEKTEPAGGAHRTRQLGPRDTAHAREHDRPGTAEQVAHGRCRISTARASSPSPRVGIDMQRPPFWIGGAPRPTARGAHCATAKRSVANRTSNCSHCDISDRSAAAATGIARYSSLQRRRHRPARCESCRSRQRQLSTASHTAIRRARRCSQRTLGHARAARAALTEGMRRHRIVEPRTPAIVPPPQPHAAMKRADVAMARPKAATPPVCAPAKASAAPTGSTIDDSSTPAHTGS